MHTPNLDCAPLSHAICLEHFFIYTAVPCSFSGQSFNNFPHISEGPYSTTETAAIYFKIFPILVITSFFLNIFRMSGVLCVRERERERSQLPFTRI